MIGRQEETHDDDPATECSICQRVGESSGDSPALKFTRKFLGRGISIKPTAACARAAPQIREYEGSCSHVCRLADSPCRFSARLARRRTIVGWSFYPKPRA